MAGWYFARRNRCLSCDREDGVWKAFLVWRNYRTERDDQLCDEFDFRIAEEPEKKDDRRLDISIRSFFCLSKDSCDLDDEDGKPLFGRTLKKLGPLASDEMYGFEPAIVLGGKMRLENLHKVKLDQHLSMLRQLAAPVLPLSRIDIDTLIGKE